MHKVAINQSTLLIVVYKAGQILVRRSCWASRTGGLLVVDQLDSGSFYCELIKILEDNIYNEPIPDVEPQRTEQQGRDPADMEMEDPIESTGRVINEDGGSRTSQGQGGYRSNMVDTENLTGSRTMEVGVPEEQGTDVSDGVMEDLIDNFASEHLKELPDKGEWKDEFVRVSLMENHFKEIAPGYSPMSLKLSTLFLILNIKLEMIADYFFKNLQGL
ncbi:disease resistance protein [Salix suchowensis]|nr:disease resistance protein [Salix suchowensis]